MSAGITQHRRPPEPGSRQGYLRPAFNSGRLDAQRLVRTRPGAPVWTAFVLSSPGVTCFLSCIFGILMFAAGGARLTPEFAQTLRRIPFPGIHQALEAIDAMLRGGLHRWNAGPGVFQDFPAEFVLLFVAFLIAGLAPVLILRWVVCIAAPPVRSHWSTFRCTTWLERVCRDAGRLYGFWEEFAGGPNSLRRKTVVGSQYLLLRAGVKMLCDIVRLTVFGWVLVAADYGLHALVMMVITLLESFSSLGLDIMIQRDDDDTVMERLPVYWTIQFVRGTALFVFTWIAAPWVARMYAAELTRTRYDAAFFVGLTRFMGTVFLLRGAAGFGRELCQRRLDFRRVIMYDTAVHVVTLVAGLILLLTVRNVIALAAIVYLAAVGRLMTSYVLAPWRPRFAWETRVAREVLVFSSGIVTIALLNSLGSRIDHAVVGKVLGMAALGFYGRAYALATIPSQSFTNIIAPVMLPALKAVAHDMNRFRRAFRRCLAAYLGGSLLLTVLFGAAAYPVVKYLFGRNGYWLPILPPLYVLLLFGVSRAAGSLTPSALFVLNRPWLVAGCTAIWAGGVAVGVWPMTVHFGLMGAACTVVAASLASNGVAVWLVFRLTTCSPESTRNHSRGPARSS